MPKQWTVQFDLLLNNAAGNRYLSILHLTIGRNSDVYGGRTPAIFLMPGGTKVHITSAVSGDRSYIVNTEPFPMNTFIQVKVEQVYTINDQYAYNIYIDGQQLHHDINTQPKVFYDVKVYAGNIWNSPADGILKNLFVRIP